MKHTPMFIEIHALQTVPPSNINRDDTGSPKTARFGGVTRARVSSQAWKRAIRDRFAEELDTSELGQRTKYVVDMIAERILDSNPELEGDDAQELAADVLAKTGIKVGKDKSTGYLVFVSSLQVEKLAELAIDSRKNGEDIDAKAAKNVLNIKESPVLNALDIAMFGRMVADDPSLNVDAAVQVAHAIGISKSETEFDYFTALDDRSPADNAGAAMIETTEFLSATLYRYANVDVYHLCENLGSYEATQKAVATFVRAFLTSMPSGKQNSFANATLPSAVLVTLRDGQSVNLANAFEQPVVTRDGEKLLEVACKRLVEQEKRVEDAFSFVPNATYIICAGDGAEELSSLDGATECNLSLLIESIAANVDSYLAASELPSDIEEQ